MCMQDGVRNLIVIMLLCSVELKKIAWNGIPNDLRPVAWQLLLVSSRMESSGLRNDLNDRRDISPSTQICDPLLLHVNGLNMLRSSTSPSRKVEKVSTNKYGTRSK